MKNYYCKKRKTLFDDLINHVEELENVSLVLINNYLNIMKVFWILKNIKK